MGTLLVVLLSKRFELLLLILKVAARGVSGALLQRAVHPFMDAILLRVTWLDELGVDAQLDPPHRQVRQSAQCVGGERDAVVGANTAGKPESAEKPSKVG